MAVRDPDAEITDEHRDLAASLQECLDRTVLHLCGAYGKSTGQRRLAMAGGVALNCTANGHLMRSGVFDEIYIQPAAADDGSALGAALYRAMKAGEVRNTRFPGSLISVRALAARVKRTQRSIISGMPLLSSGFRIWSRRARKRRT